MDKLTKQDIFDFLKYLAAAMPAHSDELRELDAQVGDGDLGVTISIGMKGLADGLPALAGQDIGGLLARSGMNFNRAAASTFGVLFASALMRAGKAAQGKDEINLTDLAELFLAAAQGAQQRGKAELGDKTILDVMFPIAEELKKAAADSSDIPAAVARAHARGQEALAATASLTPKHGRAGWLKEKGAGLQDPGATAICLMLACFKDFVSQRDG